MLDRLFRRRSDASEHRLTDTFRQIPAELREGQQWGLAPLKQSATAQRLLGSTPEEQIEAVVAALSFGRRRVNTTDDDYQVAEVCREIANALLRRNLPWDEQSLTALLDALIAQGERRGRPFLSAGGYGDPVNGVLRVVERFADGEPVPEPLPARLVRIRELLTAGSGADERKAARRIDTLLGVEPADTGPLVSADDQWAQALLATRDTLDDTDRSTADRVLEMATGATSNKPTKSFRADSRQIADELGAGRLGELAGGLLSAAAATGADARHGQVPPETGDTLRGLCWLAAAAGGEPAARALAAMALAGWKKVPQYGPMCQKAANAAIGALAELPEGAPQLGRLRSQLKQPAAVRSVDAAIDHAAQQLGIPRVEFEERVVPHFDLDHANRRAVTLGEYTAELALTADGACALQFRNSAGKTIKSVPAAVKSDHAERLAELKQAAKDIKAMAGAQRMRLERLLMDDRTWAFDVWRDRYLDHGLVGAFARRLIWTVDGHSVIWLDGQLTAADDRCPPPSPSRTAIVRLWHPVGADPEEVKRWRRFLEDREITQPFKQAHREVYLLTAAEEQTRTYSNRFAAHILRQHQMAALARGRGWRYALQGAWDQPDEQATLELPQHQLTGSFWVERPWDAQDWNDAGVFNHVLSDQVRFSDPTGEAVPLDTIAPRVFSEVMRDVDLFVGVTSIGNDPTWADQGERRYRDYWHDYAFGELTEQANVRRDLLARLLPKLVIRDVARLDRSFLQVEGKLRTYKIHLGSGNILMEPNDEYLCIVPGRGGGPADKVFLPFEGDQVLGVILSKAFLLAKDDTIDDETITAQINRRR